MIRKMRSCFRRRKWFLLCLCMCGSLTLMFVYSRPEGKLKFRNRNLVADIDSDDLNLIERALDKDELHVKVNEVPHLNIMNFDNAIKEKDKRKDNNANIDKNNDIKINNVNIDINNKEDNNIKDNIINIDNNNDIKDNNVNIDINNKENDNVKDNIINIDNNNDIKDNNVNIDSNNKDNGIVKDNNGNIDNNNKEADKVKDSKANVDNNNKENGNVKDTNANIDNNNKENGNVKDSNANIDNNNKENNNVKDSNANIDNNNKENNNVKDSNANIDNNNKENNNVKDSNANIDNNNKEKDNVKDSNANIDNNNKENGDLKDSNANIDNNDKENDKVKDIKANIDNTNKERDNVKDSNANIDNNNKKDGNIDKNVVKENKEVDSAKLERDNKPAVNANNKNPSSTNETASGKDTVQLSEIDLAMQRFQSKTSSFGNVTQGGMEARKNIMAALEKDKESTHEIDLSKVNPKLKEVNFPPFIDFGQPGDPGEGGNAVEIPKATSFNKAEKDKEDEEYNINQFSLKASQKVAVHRTLWDAQDEKCKPEEDYELSTFPPCSVVLVFHDEAWTTLLRSVHSILDRTPRSALLEIILLDDASDQDHLKTPLEVYLKPLKIVRLIRATKRMGLIKARNLGFVYAKGEIIIFLDSHIECFPGWLEPLVAPIVDDPRTVTYPSIPIIDRFNFGVRTTSASAVGSVRINSMTFKWDHYHSKGFQSYYTSPTMPGGLYAVSKRWFHHLGAYDPELMFWGGENLEISFKIWMCGGKILSAACSLVGHVFRDKSPFHVDGFSKAIQRNTLRVTDTWLDQYKHFYLEKFTYMIDPFGDTSTQKRLRQGLQCKDFRWYLDNVNTRLKQEMDVDGVYSGLIKNNGIKQCLVTASKGELRDVPYLMPCNTLHYRQVWQLGSTGFLTMYDKMMCTKTFRRHKPGLFMDTINIDKPEKFLSFSYDESHRLMHTTSKLCLDVDLASPSKKIILAPCGDSLNQRWTLQTRKELQAFHKKRGVTGIQW